MELRPLLTTKEVAKLFGVSVQTIDRWRKVGELRSVKMSSRMGGTVRFHRDDVIEYIKSHRV